MSKKISYEEAVSRVFDISQNIEILDKFYIGAKYTVSAKCKIDGHEWTARWQHLFRGTGCPKCSSLKLSKRQSLAPIEKSIFTVKPEWVILFKNKEESKITYPNATYPVNLVCPNCGTERKSIPNSMYRFGFICDSCSISISLGERMFSNLLLQLGLNFERQFKFKDYNKRFDFFIIELNCVVEIQGSQHFLGWGGNDEDLEYQIKNDEFKKKIANDNGVNYISIDCSKSDLNFVKTNIERSCKEIINTSIVDWEDIMYKSQFNSTKEIWDMWDKKDELETLQQFANRIGFSRHCVRKYLKIGNQLGLCNYSTESSRKTASTNVGKSRGKKVYCYDSDYSLIETFSSIREASLITGKTNIRNYCMGNVKPKDGLIWSLKEIIK